VWNTLHTFAKSKDSHFNIFQQERIPAQVLCKAFPEYIFQRNLAEYADDAWLLELPGASSTTSTSSSTSTSPDESTHSAFYGFLFETDYAAVGRYNSFSLGFKEIVAIHFPEGRTLAEVWERFYADKLIQEDNTLQYNQKVLFTGSKYDSTLGSDFRVPSWAVLDANKNNVYKVHPDNDGCDLIYWTISGSQITVNIIQVKVGKKHYTIKMEDVDTFLECGYPDKFKQVPLPRTSNYKWSFQKHFITSKKIAADVKNEFSTQKVNIRQLRAADEWGPLVQNYCKMTNKVLFE